jgi:DNA modification methylase
MENQNKLSEEEKDEFIEELNLTPEKIKEDMEKMKSVEGFPIGDDEDILELSSPPYYTAYPNPYIKRFIEKYGKPYDAETDDYKCEPFVGDVSEGKNDPIYLMHSYHTKVPYKAIIPFIKHYTKKGDLVLDCFCGTGMAGVAAKQCSRKAVLFDLSPVATFISENYNDVNDKNYFDEANLIMNKLIDELGWMFKTDHENEKKQGDIIYTIWSDNYACPSCKSRYSFFEVAVDINTGKIKKKYFCHNCKFDLTKNKGDLCFEEIYDDLLDSTIKIKKQSPAIISYLYEGKRFRKKPSKFDLELLNKINKYKIPYWVPTYRLPPGDESRRNDRIGYTHTHHFYTRRNLIILSAFASKLNTRKRFGNITSTAGIVTKRYRFVSQGNSFGAGGGPMSGTLYVPSLSKELSMSKVILEHIKKTRNAKINLKKEKNIISTQSSTKLPNLPSQCIDYIFTDPPFGNNLMYSELNFITESWLKVFTNNDQEAILNKTQNKTTQDYYQLMTQAFKECFRVLKPNRWITVEFHNSSASIWKAIQESIIKAGFIIAQVAILDKQQTTFKQVTSAGSVKNDLVINAYKPSEEFRNVFLKKAGLNMEREFILMHLDKLPIEPNVERTQQMLYSKLLAQYIQNGFEVRMDASEFYGLLRNNFIERDGFWFNSNQISEYEKRIKLSKTIKKFDISQTILWINDEKSAIIWLANFLRTSKTYSEIQQEYFPKISQTNDTMPDLRQILEENFVTEDGRYRIPSINEKKEREDVRNKRLIKEFNEIIKEAKSGKKIKEVRKEALLHGLMELYNKRDVDQIKIIGSKLDKKIVESDDDIYAIIDWAMTKEDSP